MRLTLRTLLAYLDDTLEPSQAREIGQKVAESAVAQELVERLKKVTRRRGLTVPPAAGPDKVEANTIAEYLDNDLSSEKVAEIEEHALGSDVVLAEIAACHQILTLVLGEPANVPPTARQRMYQLVKGRESIQNRRATRLRPQTYPGEAVVAEELRAARRGIGYRLLGAGILAVALVVALWQALPRPVRPASGSPGAVADNGTPPTPDTDSVKAPDADKPPPAKSAEADKGSAPAAPAKAPDPAKIPGVGKPPVVPPIPKASAERKEIGRFASRDKALLSRERESDPWVRVAHDVRIRSAAALLSLPGSASELRLDSGVVMTVWGNLPDVVNAPVLDTKVTLHVPAPGFDVDVSLDRGRVYLSMSKKPGPAKVRARFADQVWDVTLIDEATEILLDSVTLFAGEPFLRDGKGEPPLTNVTLGVLKGHATVQAAGKEYSLEAPGPEGAALAGLDWNRKKGLGKLMLGVADVPAAWAKAPARPLPRERALDVDSAQKKLLQRLGDKDKSVDLALAEMADDPARPSKVLGAFCHGALDKLPQLIDDLTDPGLHELRAAAIVALQNYIARAPGNDVQLFAQLQEKKGYGEKEAETALTLLHGYAELASFDPGTFQTLIATLGSERIGLRELAIWQLLQLDPDSRIRFNAADSEMQRERAIADWKRRIPDGKLPPGKNGAQGRVPARAPTRG